MINHYKGRLYNVETADRLSAAGKAEKKELDSVLELYDAVQYSL